MLEESYESDSFFLATFFGLWGLVLEFLMQKIFSLSASIYFNINLQINLRKIYQFFY